MKTALLGGLVLAKPLWFTFSLAAGGGGERGKDTKVFTWMDCEREVSEYHEVFVHFSLSHGKWSWKGR